MATDNELIGNLVDATFATAEATNALVTQALEAQRLTLPQAKALWMMRPEAPPASMRSLAAMMNYDPSTMTFVADKLEEKGLLLRRVDPQNRRVKLLELTESGKLARTHLLARLADSLPASHLSVDEQCQLFRLLSKALELSRAAADTCQ